LDGFFVCVLSGWSSGDRSVDELRTLALKNGAKIVENPLCNEPKCINLAGDVNFRVQALKKSKRYDIVSVKWFLDVCEKQAIELNAEDMICMTPVLEEQFKLKIKPFNENPNDDIYIESYSGVSDDFVEGSETMAKQFNDFIVYTADNLNSFLENVTLEEVRFVLQ